jgi:hypothetical protein
VTTSPDYWYIGIDHTKFWVIPECLKPYLERILTIYAFDRSTGVNCCEITPSYYCECIAHEPHYALDTPEEIRDKIHEFVQCSDYDPSYFHCHHIEQLLIDRPEWSYHLGSISGYDDREPGEEINQRELSQWLHESWDVNPKF